MATRTRTKNVEEKAAPIKSSNEVLIANYHTGGIVFPRKGPGGVLLTPLRLAPGMVTPMPRDEWNDRKRSKIVQDYIDGGLIGEVRRRVAQVPVEAKTTDLEIPEHLRSEDHEGKVAPTPGRVRRQKAGSIEV